MRLIKVVTYDGELKTLYLIHRTVFRTDDDCKLMDGFIRSLRATIFPVHSPTPHTWGDIVKLRLETLNQSECSFRRDVRLNVQSLTD